MNLKVFLVSFIALIYSNILVAQTNVNKGRGDNNIVEDIPYFNVHEPPPPDVNNFTDYSNSVTNNLHTGTIGFNIPVTTIICNNYSHSVSFNYSSNGVRSFNQITPRWGNSWTLSAGGFISRTVNDEPDDKYGIGLLHSWWYDKISNSNLTLNDKRELADNDYDTELDVFSFNIDGYSGEFYIIPTDDGNKVVLSPHQNLKIEPVLENNTTIISFTITTDNGLKYYFNQAESTHYFTNKKEFTYISRWYLTSIENMNGIELMSFEYSLTEYEYIGHGLGYLNFELDNNVDRDYAYQGLSDEDIVYFDVNTFLLEKIIGPNSYVVFDTEYNPLTGTPSNYIKIYDNNDSLRKQIDIFYTSIGCEIFNYGLLVSTENNDNNYKYMFEYYEEYAFYENYRDIIKHRDIWGFFNGPYSGSEDYPYLNVYGELVTGASLQGNRVFNEDYAITGLLKKITFPTGGSAEIEYEPHQFFAETSWKNQFPFLNDYTPNTFGAGFRLKQINYKNVENNTVLIKKFSYEGGKQLSYPDYYLISHFFVGEMEGSAMAWYARERLSVLSEPDIPFSTENGSLVAYDKVTEEQTSILTSEKMITEYSFDNEIDVVTAQTLNASVYGDDNNIVNASMSLKHLNSFKNKRGHTINVVNKNFDNDLIYNTTNIYNNALGTVILYGYKVRRIRSQGQDMGNQAPELFEYPYSFAVGIDKEIIETRETTYTDNNSFITKKTTFDRAYVDNYNFPFNLLTATTIYDDNNTITTEFTYPYSSSDNIADNMINKYLVSAVMKKTTINNGTVISLVKTNYNFFNNSILPNHIKVLNTLTNIMESVSVVDKYDNYGNIIQFHNNYNIPITILWGYNHIFPIAKIENATFEEIIQLIDLSNTTLQNPSDDEQLRDFLQTLRNAPSISNAFIYTYTYDKIYGMTSQTDPNGVTVFYEYDAFGRLESIRDQDGNVIQHYEYNYYNTLLNNN
ncbi:MAG: RHS repeat protein [Bacteroidales bacterium]|nr:RHS repeat protein [Bacteroidales bacterium]